MQTGFGRSGTMFASEWLDGGVRPDILICAKGIANGFPMSAIGMSISCEVDIFSLYVLLFVPMFLQQHARTYL